jgi:uncharacterized lipoprotein YmbA
MFKAIICIGLLASFAWGCSGTPNRSNYYLLSAVQNDDAGDIMGPNEDGVILGIGPVTLPEYVNRFQVITRTSRNEITFSEFERWAEPLKINFIRTFSENLAYLIKTDDIFIYPWLQGTAVEYIVTADVIQFDARLGDSAVLDVRWSLLRGNDREMLVNEKKRFATAVPSSDYAALVAALSASLNEFSREVATAIAQNYRRDHRN